MKLGTLAIVLLILLHQQMQAGETPISFYGLREGEQIRFSADAEQYYVFEIEVESLPTPKAWISLQIHAALNLDQAAKAWGHPVNVKVEKILTPADIKLLENHLVEIRSKSVPKKGWGYDFELEHKATLPNGQGISWHWEEMKRERYFLTPKQEPIEHHFVEEFVGFKP